MTIVLSMGTWWPHLHGQQQEQRIPAPRSLQQPATRPHSPFRIKEAWIPTELRWSFGTRVHHLGLGAFWTRLQFFAPTPPFLIYGPVVLRSSTSLNSVTNHNFKRSCKIWHYSKDVVLVSVESFCMFFTSVSWDGKRENSKETQWIELSVCVCVPGKLRVSIFNRLVEWQNSFIIIW